jgi:hypothetical protein
MENIFQYVSNFLLLKFFEILFIFGPNLAFIPQISNFRQSKSNKGFSKKITLIILLADIFRIFYWLVKRFEKILLIQSIISIFMQLFLLYECLKVSNIDNDISLNKEKNNNLDKNSIDLFTELQETQDTQETIEETKLIKSENENKLNNNLNLNDENEIKDDYIIINKDTYNKIKIKKDNEEDQNEKNKIIKEDFNSKNNSKNKNIYNKINTKNKNSEIEIREKGKGSYNKEQFQFQDQDIENLIDIMRYKNDFIYEFDQKRNLDLIFDPKMFWEWPFLITYIIFLSFLWILLMISFSFFHDIEIYRELLGYITILFECCVAMPQIIQNYSNKSTNNLSIAMILIWFILDFLKTIYFLLLELPFKFFISCIIQIIFDCVIICQMNYYK